MSGFADRLLAWYDAHGRKSLPWQSPRTPYRVWLSEVMLQQTQVATVIPYFERFVAELPTLEALADAPLDRVLALWSGLGYYSRARNLHLAAQRCVAAHGGGLPREIDTLASLPGIGRSTAAAILAQAHGDRQAILDGNVKRVLARHRGVEGDVASTKVQRVLWSHAESLLPHARLADYTQAIMDLGATVCTRANPACLVCPVADDCVARIAHRQHELPWPKRAKAAPERTRALLVVLDDANRVRLAPRPPVGLWGGLWSVEEFDDEAALAAYARDRYGARATESLAPFTHAFTHFKLLARPHLVRTTRLSVADGGARYCTLDELGSIGMPTPIRKLVVDLLESERCPAPSTASA